MVNMSDLEHSCADISKKFGRVGDERREVWSQSRTQAQEEEEINEFALELWKLIYIEIEFKINSRKG